MSDDSSKPRPSSQRPLSGNSPSMEDDDDFWELEDLPKTPPQSKSIEKQTSSSGVDTTKSKTDENPTQSLANTESDLTSKKRLFPHSSALEKVLMGVVALILLLGFGFSAKALHKLLPTGKEESFKPTLPLKGQLITITDASTYWRRPIKEGEDAHQIKDGIKIIPAAQLKLSQNSNGILRCFFTDDRNQFIGDGITLNVTNGTFEKTGNDTIEIHCTDGFPEISDFAYYQTKAHEKEYRWRIVITEGKDLNTRGDDLTQIAKLPISPILFSDNNK